jgi:hypothetical protein
MKAPYGRNFKGLLQYKDFGVNVNLDKCVVMEINSKRGHGKIKFTNHDIQEERFKYF